MYHCTPESIIDHLFARGTDPNTWNMFRGFVQNCFQITSVLCNYSHNIVSMICSLIYYYTIEQVHISLFTQKILGKVCLISWLAVP